MDTRDSLRQEVRQLLLDSLQPGVLRITGTRLKALQALDEYPLILIDLIKIENENQLVKTISATQLKAFTATVTAATVVTYDYGLKENIALTLVDLLSCQNRGLAELLSAALGNLIIGEFPTLFNSIANKLMSLLLNGNHYEIRGALIFMHDFSNDNEHFCSIHDYFTTDFLEPLINILQNELLPLEIKILTIRPMMQILISSRHNSTIFQTTSSRLCGIFCKYLSEPYSLTNNFYLKSELVSEILHLLNAVDHATNFVTNCLPSIGQLMSNCCTELKEIMMRNNSIPKDEGEQESENFPQLIKNMLQLIKDILLKPNYTNLIMNSLSEFIYLLFILMAAYSNVEDDLFDENCLKKEIDPSYWSTMRGTCAQILMTFMDKCDDCLLLQVFQNVTQRHMNEINITRSNQNLSDCSYKILEAIMYSFGLFADVYIEPSLQLRNVVEYWSTMFLNAQTNWLVVARLLWLGSKYSRMLPESLLTQHLTAVLYNYNTTIKGLRIACIDALGNHLSTIEYHPHKTVFISMNQQITDRLLTLSIRSSSNIAFAELQSFGYFYEVIDFIIANLKRSLVTCGRVLLLEILMCRYCVKYY